MHNLPRNVRQLQCFEAWPLLCGLGEISGRAREGGRERRAWESKCDQHQRRAVPLRNKKVSEPRPPPPPPRSLFVFPPGKSFLQSLNEGRREGTKAPGRGKNDRKNNTRRGGGEASHEASETKGLPREEEEEEEVLAASDNDKWDGGGGDENADDNERTLM